MTEELETQQAEPDNGTHAGTPHDSVGDPDIQMSEKIDLLATALIAAQSEMKSASKDSDNPFFKSKYADLTAVNDAVMGPITKHGLCLMHLPTSQGKEAVAVTAQLTHKSGQWIRCRLTFYPAKADPQTMLGTITYLRRSMTSALVNSSSEIDDDGNTASGKFNGVTTTGEPITPHTATTANLTKEGEVVCLASYTPQKKLDNGKKEPYRFTFETADGPVVSATTQFPLKGVDMNTLPDYIGCDVKIIINRKGNANYLTHIELPDLRGSNADV
jgi:hypothetical protein